MNIRSALVLGGGSAGFLAALALKTRVPGLRTVDPKGSRERLVAFLVATFEEVVYI